MAPSEKKKKALGRVIAPHASALSPCPGLPRLLSTTKPQLTISRRCGWPNRVVDVAGVNFERCVSNAIGRPKMSPSGLRFFFFFVHASDKTKNSFRGVGPKTCSVLRECVVSATNGTLVRCAFSTKRKFPLR